MAARMSAKFYVYEILSDAGDIIYVGKGSGNRINVSKRHQAGFEAREVARFFNELDAYDFEVKHIAETNPQNNKHAGGNGSFSGFVKNSSGYVSKEVRDMRRIGARAYAARLLINYVSAYKELISKVDLTKKENELIKCYTKDVIGALNSIDVNKMIEVGYGRRT
jgi:hypothetical protein